MLFLVKNLFDLVKILVIKVVNPPIKGKVYNDIMLFALISLVSVLFSSGRVADFKNHWLVLYFENH